MFDSASRHRTTLRLAQLVPCLLLFSATTARAALPGDLDTNFDIDDGDPIKSIPTQAQRDANPLEFGYFLQNLVVRAEGAFEKRDWAGAVKYYEALARIVPDRAVSFSRLCTAYAGLGKVEVAAANCGKAVQLGGALVYDHLQFINISLRKRTLSPADIGDIEASLAHLRAHVAKSRARVPAPATSASGAPPGTPSGAADPPPASARPEGDRSAEQVKAELLARAKGGQPNADVATATAEQAKPKLDLPIEIQVLDCKFAVRLRDGKRLDRCVQALGDMKVDEKLVVPFEWSHALIDKDATRAAAALARARTLNLPEPALRAMLDEQETTFSATSSKRIAAIAIAALAAATLLAFGFWWLSLGARRRKLETTGQV